MEVFGTRTREEALLRRGRDRIPAMAVFGIVGLFMLTLPAYMGTAYVSLFTKVLIWALLAMSLDLMAGYTGLWSFCQAALFGAGFFVFLGGLGSTTNFWE